MVENARRRAEELDFWDGPVTAETLSSGPRGDRLLVNDGGQEYVVRIAEDQPEHAIYHYNEIAVSQAAHDAGVSPALIHHEAGALIFQNLNGSEVMEAADLEQEANLDRLVGLLGQCHLDLPGHLEVPGPMFWVFHLNRRYARIIMQHGGALAPSLTRLMARNDELESVIGPIQPVFCNNNLTPEAVLDDGQRYWLIDWSHGGWNDGLYDLACVAAELDTTPEIEDAMLRRYRNLTDETAAQTDRRTFAAWKCAALLWSGLWSGVGDMFADRDFDFAAHSQQRLERLDHAFIQYREI